MIENSRDEEVCRAWDVLADEDHTYHASEEEYFYHKNNWWISLNKAGNDTQTLRKRSDFKQALSTLKRLHQEAGGDQLEPIPYWKYKTWTGHKQRARVREHSRARGGDRSFEGADRRKERVPYTLHQYRAQHA